jgi:hypothetical protein
LHTQPSKGLNIKAFDGFFYFLLFVECNKKFRLPGAMADFALHATNGNSKGVHPTNGNKADLNSVFTRHGPMSILWTQKVEHFLSA